MFCVVLYWVLLYNLVYVLIFWVYLCPTHIKLFTLDAVFCFFCGIIRAYAITASETAKDTEQPAEARFAHLLRLSDGRNTKKTFRSKSSPHPQT